MKHPYFISLFLCFTATFLLSQSNPVPFVNQPLAPSSAPPGSPGLTLTVNGTQFVSTSVVNWNGTPLSTTFVSFHQLMANVPGSNLTSASTASVTVSSPAPGGGTSNTVFFTITNPTTTLAFATSTIPTGLNPGGLVVADFNNDGKADLAVLNRNETDPSCYSIGGPGTISILLGNGDGTFSNKSTLCLVADPEYGLVVGPQLLAGDFNGDGNTDLVLSLKIDQLGDYWLFEVFLGNGDGTFASPGLILLDSLNTIETVVVGDFTGDGKLDLVVPGYPDEGPFPVIQDFLGDGGGTFSYGPAFNLSGFAYNGSLVTGDFNNDGILDLALSGGSQLTILLGNGDGTFTPVASQPDVNPGSGSMIVGDFNGDGILDLITPDAVLFGNGDGTFTQGPALLPCDPVAAANFNGDGKLDLVCSGANIISILLGNGDGTFQTGFIDAVDAPNAVGVADFNGDGRLDLAVTDSSDNTVSILLQKPARNRATATMASGQNPVYVTQPVTYTAVVWASPITPTGSVTFKQSATVLGTVPLANGQASFTTTFASAGTFPIVASYSGDQNYPAKYSRAVKQFVDKYASYSAVFSAPNPSVQGQAVTLTCNVASEALTQPTGTVTFKNGAASLGTVPLVNGSALLTKTNLPAGTLSITATYDGDSLNSKVTSPMLSQVVSQAITTTTVTSSPNPSVVGQNVKFKATVESQTVRPVGTVTFTAGTTTLGSVNLAGGEAGLITSALPVGTTTVTATYNGTSNISGSSGSVAQTVN